MRAHRPDIADCSANGGFTLMEVLVALVILSASIYILLSHHYTIMGLQQTISDELIYSQLVETAVGIAELGVTVDKLADAGDFGERFAEYAWHYEAVLSGQDELIPLYAISLTIDGPADSRTYEFFYYNTGNPESTDGAEEDRGGDRDRSGGSDGSRDRDRGSGGRDRDSDMRRDRDLGGSGGFGGGGGLGGRRGGSLGSGTRGSDRR